MEKVTGLESLLSDKEKFNNWCFELAESILDEKILNKGVVSQKIKSKIKNDEKVFYEMLCSDLERKIEITKKTASEAFKSNKSKKYIELGFEISSLKNRLKKFNIERTKAYQRNNYFLLKKFLTQSGNECLFDEFKKQID